MSIDELVNKFINNPCYLSNGAGQLSTRWNISKDTIKQAKREARLLINDIGETAPNKPIDTPTISKILKEVKNINIDNEKIEPKGKLLKRWGKEGSWQESYSYDNKTPEGFEIDKILSNIDFNAIKPISIPIQLASEKVLNVYLTDQHIGASVTNGIYTNYFDDIEYGNRMDKVFGKIVDMDTFSKINVLFLGDTFDGQDGYTVKRTHKLPQNLSNTEAFETAIKVNMKFIDNLVNFGCANQYNVYCVSDSNHGGNMDYYLFRSLEEIIKYKYPKVGFAIANNFIDYFVEGTHTFIYTHGKDGKDMKYGLPLDLNDKTENFINQYIDNYEINTKNIHFIKGDLHQNALSTGKKFDYRNVPSLFGSSAWIMKNFGNTKPGVGFDIFSKECDDIVSGVIKL